MRFDRIRREINRGGGGGNRRANAKVAAAAAKETKGNGSSSGRAGGEAPLRLIWALRVRADGPDERRDKARFLGWRQTKSPLPFPPPPPAALLFNSEARLRASAPAGQAI
jgi:hypothetical protein